VGASIDPFGRSLNKDINHIRVHTHVVRFEDIDLGMALGQGIGGGVNSLHQNAVKKHKGQHDDALGA
jgi:hypothetical protein